MILQPKQTNKQPSRSICACSMLPERRGRRRRRRVNQTEVYSQTSHRITPKQQGPCHALVHAHPTNINIHPPSRHQTMLLPSNKKIYATYSYIHRNECREEFVNDWTGPRRPRYYHYNCTDCERCQEVLEVERAIGWLGGICSLVTGIPKRMLLCSYLQYETAFMNPF